MDKIEFVLLGVAAVALAVLSMNVLGYIERTKHINKIKKMLAEDSETTKIELLRTKKRQYEQSWEYKIKHIMTQAGIQKYQLSVFFLTYFTLFLFFSAFLSTFLQSYVIGFLGGFVFGSYTHYLIIKALIRRRLQEFNKALAVAISVLVKMMRNGVGFEQSLVKAVNVSSSKMFKSIFETFFKEKNTLGEEKAFENMLVEVDSKELRVFAIAVKIGRDSGGRFSQTLQKLETTIRYRKKIQDRVNVVTREGTIGSYIVAAIAVFLYFALNLNFDGKMHAYYMSSQYGRYQLLGIVSWIVIGLIVNKAITKVEK